METLQRFQALDYLLALLWVGSIVWGVRSGVLRQVTLLLAVYFAAVLAALLYRPAGQAAAMALGWGAQPRSELLAYVGVFFLVVGVLALGSTRAYPSTRLGGAAPVDSVLGGILGAAWGALLLIALVTMLRFYAATPWPGQELSQGAVAAQVRASQVALGLEEVLAPLWGVMAAWFPEPVGPQLS